jgi:hypothetical protein
MDRENKEKLASAGVRIGALLFGKLMDRRAAKGGKLVNWWRENIGRITPTKISDFVDSVRKQKK